MLDNSEWQKHFEKEIKPSLSSLEKKKKEIKGKNRKTMLISIEVMILVYI